MPKLNVAFNEWSLKWEDARSNPDVDAVLRLWESRVPTNWQRSSWTGKLGYRHNHKEGGGSRGEQQDEKKFLERFLHRVVVGSEHHPLLAVYQKFPLANQRQYQRIADVLGLLLAWGRASSRAACQRHVARMGCADVGRLLASHCSFQN